MRLAVRVRRSFLIRVLAWHTKFELSTGKSLSGGLAMKDDGPFGRPSLVINNDKDEGVFRRSTAAARKRRQLTIHREWNDQTEWWVGHVFAGSKVYRIGGFADLERACAATLSYFHDIMARIDGEDAADAEPPARSGVISGPGASAGGSGSLLALHAVERGDDA
jgi:hypothetical protein